MTHSLLGKNIILTGASRGFGRFLAKELWRHGANLMLTARSSAELYGLREELWRIRARPNRWLKVESFDLSRADCVASITYTASDGFDQLDGLINNAATQGPVGNLSDAPVDEVLATLNLNLNAPIALCQATIPWMIARGHGKIVNLSGGGAASPRPRFSAYAASKAGLVGFTQTLAEELKGTGIDVNAVAPGAMLTDMTKGQNIPGLTQEKSDATMQKAADLIVYLLSDESDGITGRLLAAQWDNFEDATFKERVMSDPDLYTLRRLVKE